MRVVRLASRPRLRGRPGAHRAPVLHQLRRARLREAEALTADWGTPPWDTGAPRPRLALPPACDVAVIGAGLTGLSAAYHLARRGADVVLLEADRIGAGASGHTGAIALEGTSVGPLEEASDCLAALSRVVEEARIDCDLRLPGCWELEHRPPAHDAQPLWRDGDGHLYIARTEPGGTVDVGALLRGLAHAASQAGARIAEH